MIFYENPSVDIKNLPFYYTFRYVFIIISSIDYHFNQQNHWSHSSLFQIEWNVGFPRFSPTLTFQASPSI